MSKVTSSIIGGQRRLATTIGQKIAKLDSLVKIATFNVANLAAKRMKERINESKDATRQAHGGKAAWQTGNQLADSIMVDPAKPSLQLTVGTSGVPHAIYYEYGTGERGEASPSPPKGELPAGAYDPDWKGMEARPYAHPTAEEMRDELPKAIEAAIKEGWK